MAKSMLIDTSKCTACRACQVACKQWNQLPAEETKFSGTYENPPRFSPVTWMKVTFREVEVGDEVRWYFGNQRCMHCSDAACALVCPVGAITHTETGAVSIDPKKCIGCNYCVGNCTFDVMGYSRRDNMAEKCTFCEDRVANGLKPACASACPTDAIIFGERSALISRAQARAKTLRANGDPRARAYGIEELDGTGMLFVLRDVPANHALPADPVVPFGARAWNYVFKPLRVLMVLGAAFGLWRNYRGTEDVKQGKSRGKQNESA